MEESETKNITVPPEDAYGIWNESLAEMFGMGSIELDAKDNKTQIINISQFQTTFTEVELKVGSQFDYGALVFEINNTINATIIALDDENITFLMDFINGTTVTLPIFNWNITFTNENDTHYNMHSDIPDGHTFSIEYGFSAIHFKAIEVNETHAKLAVNFDAPKVYYVDQTLLFEITVEKVFRCSS
jgi:FKBP-type peptidyl-prolyl cis-trans isomerase 2